MNFESQLKQRPFFVLAANSAGVSLLIGKETEKYTTGVVGSVVGRGKDGRGKDGRGILDFAVEILSSMSFAIPTAL